MAPTDDMKKKTSLLYLGGAGVLACVVLASAFLIFTFEEADQLVLIKAPLTPVRVAPDDPGGLKINSIDSPVMSLLDEANTGNSVNQEGTEVLVPPESEPELPPINLTDNENTASQSQSEQDNQASETGAGTSAVDSEPVMADDGSKVQPATVEIVTTEAGENSASETTETTQDVKSTPSQDDQTASEEPKAKTETKSSTPVVAESAANQSTNQTAEAVAPVNEITAAINNLPGVQPTERPKTPKIFAPADSDTPTFVVQFAAFKSEGRAKNTAAVLSAKHAERLGDLTIGYMKRDDFWRVVSEPLPRPDAIALCRNFRSVGQDCITKLIDKQP